MLCHAGLDILGKVTSNNAESQNAAYSINRSFDGAYTTLALALSLSTFQPFPPFYLSFVPAFAPFLSAYLCTYLSTFLCAYRRTYAPANGLAVFFPSCSFCVCFAWKGYGAKHGLKLCAVSWRARGITSRKLRPAYRVTR